MQETQVGSWEGRPPEEGNGNPLQNSCLENPMGRGVWWATDHGVTKSRTCLSARTHMCADTRAHTHTHNRGKSNHEEKITRATKARKELMGKKIYGRAPLEERISSC